MNVRYDVKDGVEFAILPRIEFDAMRERLDDLADVQAADVTLRAVAEGGDEFVPAAIAERLIGGESPLRVWRRHRGFTQQALADRSGVNRVQIAEIESGRRTGSVETLKKLARALAIQIDDLV